MYSNIDKKKFPIFPSFLCTQYTGFLYLFCCFTFLLYFVFFFSANKTFWFYDLSPQKSISPLLFFFFAILAFQQILCVDNNLQEEEVKKKDKKAAIMEFDDCLLVCGQWRNVSFYSYLYVILCTFSYPFSHCNIFSFIKKNMSSLNIFFATCKERKWERKGSRRLFVM